MNSTSKAAFLADADAVKFWVEVSRSTDFRKVAMYARSMFMESHPEKLECLGADNILNVLFTMANNEDESPPFPGPGLIHTVDHDPNQKPKEAAKG